MIDAGEGIQQRQTRSRIERQHRFVLRVDHGQVRRKLLQHRNRCRLVVDEDASLAAGGNLAPQDELRLFGVEAVGFEHRVDGFGVGLEDRGDHVALSVPWRTASLEALSPSSKASASIRMDFPAPVSPVKRLRPGANSTATLSMTA